MFLQVDTSKGKWEHNMFFSVIFYNFLNACRISSNMPNIVSKKQFLQAGSAEVWPWPCVNTVKLSFQGKMCSNGSVAFQPGEQIIPLGSDKVWASLQELHQTWPTLQGTCPSMTKRPHLISASHTNTHSHGSPSALIKQTLRLAWRFLSLSPSL